MGPTASLAVAALLLTGGVLAIPSMMADRTCHNLLRDGRNGIGPQIRAYLQLNLEDWPRLTKVVEDFGIKHELSFRDSSRAQPEVIHVLGLSLCNERGVAIQLMDQRWASRDFASLLQDGGAFVGIYQVRSESGWEQLARDFVAEIENDWPGKLQFRDGSGRIADKPLELQ